MLSLFLPHPSFSLSLSLSPPLSFLLTHLPHSCQVAAPSGTSRARRWSTVPSSWGWTRRTCASASPPGSCSRQQGAPKAQSSSECTTHTHKHTQITHYRTHTFTHTLAHTHPDHAHTHTHTHTHTLACYCFLTYHTQIISQDMDNYSDTRLMQAVSNKDTHTQTHTHTHTHTHTDTHTQTHR